MNQKIPVAKALFIKAFAIALIKTVRIMKIPASKRTVINADLVPSLSEKSFTKTSHLNLKEMTPSIIVEPIKKSPAPPQPPLPGPPILIKKSPQKTFNLPKDFILAQQKYGKITPLLVDNTITKIESPGPGKNIIITRAGNKQFAKIILTRDEINQLLEKFSQEARIPLIEGVFKVAIEDFIVTSVVSESIGSRFIITKSNPYLVALERQLSPFQFVR